MDRAALRALPWPEIVIGTVVVVLFLVVMLASADPECHAWRDRRAEFMTAYLAPNGDEGSSGEATSSASELRARVKRWMDQRPFACL